MRATCLIPYWIASWFFLLSVLHKNANGTEVTLKSQNSNWNYSIDPLADENSSINSTSERYRRLIPYMTFYLTQGFLPQAQQYTPIATVGNNLDTNVRYQQQNTVAAHVPHANTLQYPLLRNAFIVRTSVPQQQNYPQPQPQAIPTQQNYQPQLITTQQNYQPHQIPSAPSPTQLQIQPQVQLQQHQYQPQPQPQLQPQTISTGLSRFSNYPQQPQSLRPIPITKPSYFTAQKQELPPLQYDFKPLPSKPQVTTIQNPHYKETEEEHNRQEDPITEVQGPLIIPQQKQLTYPKLIIQNYPPLKSPPYNPPSAEEDQGQQNAKIIYQHYNSQKQAQYPIKDIKQDITYPRPTIQNYAILPQQRYQETETIKEHNSQLTAINSDNYEEQAEEDTQPSNNEPDDEVMTIVQSQEIPVPQEDTDTVKSIPDTKQLEDLLEGYQLSKTLPDRITSANIGSSIRTLSQILKLLQQANSLSGLNKSILGQTHHADFSSNSKGHKFLQGFSPTRTEGSTPGKAGIDYPNYFEIPQTSFNCKDQRYKGFFGDPDTNCQVWHYCDLNGGQASFLCPNGTIFSQVALTCDWWFNVKCASTAQLYVLNERLYKYILPVKPSFPEDYAGPLVDEYLALKYYEIENKRKNGTKTTPTTTTTESTPDSEYNPLQSLLTNEVKRKV